MPDSLDQEIHTLQSIFWSERDPEGLAFASLADAFRRKGEVREAIDLLTDGMSRHPDYATGHVVATRLYLDQGMSSEAEISATRVLELDAENLVALSAMTSILAERGKLGEAARHRTLLMSVDPGSEEARAVADLDLEAELDLVADLDLEAETGPAVDEAPQVTDVEVDPVSGSEEAESLLDDLLPKAGTEPDDEELSEAMDALGLTGEADADEPLRASDAEIAELEAELPGPEVELPDLDAIGVDEPIEVAGEATDFGGGAPEPDEPDGEDAVDLASLAPDEPDGEDAVDLASLAPDEPEDHEVVDLAALAPDEPEDEEVVDLAALAPDEPEDEEVVDLAALGPDEPGHGTGDAVVDLAALAPDEPEASINVAELAPEADETSLDLVTDEAGDLTVEDDDASEPIYTRTLAELYIKQGFTDKALEVLRALYEMNPHATDLADRIEALEEGELDDPDAPGPASASAASPVRSSGDGHSEDEVEARARELAEQGLEDSDEVDTPFAWGEPEDAPSESGTDDEGEPAVGNYFDRLLAWEDRGES